MVWDFTKFRYKLEIIHIMQADLVTKKIAKFIAMYRLDKPPVMICVKYLYICLLSIFMRFIAIYHDTVY